MSEPVATDTYPGVHVEYFERPYRYYTVNGIEAVSVTSAIGVLNKPALMYYAERETADGLRRLFRVSGYKVPSDLAIPKGARAFRLPPKVTDDPATGTWLYKWGEVEATAKEDGKSLIRLGKGFQTLTATRIMLGHLRQRGLDHRSKTEYAAQRGVNVHQVWEDWNTRKLLPAIANYPEDQRGYIRAMAKAIMEHRPECVEAERIVGSAVHGFAGRLDTVVVVQIKDGLAMWDVKTSKDVYPSSHFPQLAGYEIARRECGLPPTQHQGILRLGADGEFEIRWSDAEPEDFLALLGAWKSQQRWTKRKAKT